MSAGYHNHIYYKNVYAIQVSFSNIVIRWNIFVQNRLFWNQSNSCSSQNYIKTQQIWEFTHCWIKQLLVSLIISCKQASFWFRCLYCNHDCFQSYKLITLISKTLPDLNTSIFQYITFHKSLINTSEINKSL